MYHCGPSKTRRLLIGQQVGKDDKVQAIWDTLKLEMTIRFRHIGHAQVGKDDKTPPEDDKESGHKRYRNPKIRNLYARLTHKTRAYSTAAVALLHMHLNH
ncbi:MAG: hypothetical protein KVP17_003255 [Porospora cf. gigantea B]|uniref:uncharacterized protein n=1 Tax=Porospora cf. gigantea B TaxID=2853592 RepID=UPI003571A064|nr:MAG: hypothetical protein KVP17_003255 [Porospora cf. gigantea B]